jgi:putative phage-type endonuclease
MGFSQFRTLKSLWREKSGLEEHHVPVTADMQRGIDNEAPALKLYVEEKKREEENKSAVLSRYRDSSRVDFAPLTIVHPVYSFLRASLDGAAPERKMFVEIKCPRTYIHDKTKQYGIIKPEYYCQMQHQYIVSGYDRCDFISYEVESGDLVWLPVEPDFDYQAELLSRSIIFWRCVEEKREPNPDDFAQYSQVIQRSVSSAMF